jgi:hypothetical protein
MEVEWGGVAFRGVVVVHPAGARVFGTQFLLTPFMQFQVTIWSVTDFYLLSTSEVMANDKNAHKQSLTLTRVLIVAVPPNKG